MPVVIYAAKVVFGFAVCVIADHTGRKTASWYKTRKALKTA